MNCEKVRDILTLGGGSDLPFSEAEDFQAHLSKCEDCQQLEQRVKAAYETIRGALLDVPEPAGLQKSFTEILKEKVPEMNTHVSPGLATGRVFLKVAAFMALLLPLGATAYYQYEIASATKKPKGIVGVENSGRLIKAYNNLGGLAWVKTAPRKVSMVRAADVNGDDFGDAIIGYHSNFPDGVILEVFDRDGEAQLEVRLNYEQAFERQTHEFVVKGIVVGDIHSHPGNEMVVSIHGWPWAESILFVFGSDGTILHQLYTKGHVDDARLIDVDNDGVLEIVARTTVPLPDPNSAGTREHYAHFVLDPKDFSSTPTQSPPFAGKNLAKGTFQTFWICMVPGRSFAGIDYFDHGNDGTLDIAVNVDKLGYFYFSRKDGSWELVKSLIFPEAQTEHQGKTLWKERSRKKD